MTLIPVAFAWQDQAACKHADLALFFGPDGETEYARVRRERRAGPICAGCPVRAECLDYAAGRPEHFGMWGGLNEDERRNLRRRRQAAERQVAS